MREADGSFGEALERVIAAIQEGHVAEAEVEYVVEREGTEARLAVIIHREPSPPLQYPGLPPRP